MAHLSGLLLIDAPASALNNAGSIPGERVDNKTAVKFIRTRGGAYPYVSAQAFRYWLRTSLEESDLGWRAAPVYREKKVAYTDANPILFWDDDLFGYMRAPSKNLEAVEAREADASQADLTPVEKDTIVSRVSPLKVSTLVSLSPVTPTDDFGVMARQEGNPVPYEHQFYKTTLKGIFGLDLRSAGTFYHREKAGYKNLDTHRKQQAQERSLEAFDSDRAYRLPRDERMERVQTLLRGMALMDGGAKQAQHYTNVAPSFMVCAVTKGGNNPFGHVVNTNSRGEPRVNAEALSEALEVFSDQFLSPLYVGWVRGFMDDQREGVENSLAERNHVLGHPRKVFERVAEDFASAENAGWLD